MEPETSATLSPASQQHENVGGIQVNVVSGGSLLARSGSGGGLLHEREVLRSAGRDAISTFLDSHTCYSVLRASGKVVVFDTRIPIQLAFYALVEHGKFD